jgi:stalled ribosome rescue protein Dom34
MAACVIWMDSEHAKVFKIGEHGSVVSEMKRHGMRHSNSHQDAHAHHQEQHFFKEICHFIGRPEELLLMGPGMTKSHFKNYLESHHKNDLYHSLVGVESQDKLTDNQVLEVSRSFFKKYHLYHP